MPYKNKEDKIKRDKRYYQKNRDRYIDKAKKYYKEHPKKNIKYDRSLLSEEEKERQRKWWNISSKKSRITHPEKWKARGMVHYAVKNGLLKKLPCEVCGREPSQAHHEDYSFPLSVTWYCAYHHRKRHEEIKNSKNFTPQLLN